MSVKFIDNFVPRGKRGFQVPLARDCLTSVHTHTHTDTRKYSDCHGNQAANAWHIPLGKQRCAVDSHQALNTQNKGNLNQIPGRRM